MCKSVIWLEIKLKALSIRQPWSWLIVAGYKDIENRAWPTSFRGRIYVHSGKELDKVALLEFRLRKMKTFCCRDLPDDKQLVRGAIIGEVDIVDCVKQSGSPWFTGPYGFVLRNPRLYQKPIDCVGRLGIFEPWG
jgi:hypothetical protein